MLEFFAAYGAEVLLAVVILIATGICKYFYGMIGDEINATLLFSMEKNYLFLSSSPSVHP